MSWNIQKPGDYINGPLTVTGDLTVRTDKLVVTSTGVGFGTLTPQAPVEVVAATTAKAKAIQFSTTGSATYGWIIAVDGAVNGNMILQSNNANVIADVLEFSRSSGNIGLGLSPSYRLDVSNSGSAGGVVDVARFYANAGSTAEARMLFGTFANVVNAGIGAQTTTGTDGVLKFYTNGSGTLSERARFNNTGAFVLAGGATGANGIGIAFPSAQSASTDANTLDDYEEGAWTPTIEGSTTAGSASYTVRNGQYTKVGRLVYFACYVVWSSGTGTGSLKITGLPFATGTGVINCPNAYIENVTLSANYIAIASMSGGVSTINIDQIPVGGGSALSVNYDATGNIFISGTYNI